MIMWAILDSIWSYIGYSSAYAVYNAGGIWRYGIMSTSSCGWYESQFGQLNQITSLWYLSELRMLSKLDPQTYWNNCNWLWFLIVLVINDGEEGCDKQWSVKYSSPATTAILQFKVSSLTAADVWHWISKLRCQIHRSSPLYFSMSDALPDS